MDVSVRQAEAADIPSVRAILFEVLHWLHEKGEPLWEEGDFPVEEVARDVEEGLYFLAESDGRVVGVVKFQLSDELFWPDVREGESAFLHRLAVRRDHAGEGVSTAILRWAVRRTARLDRRYLRLDCAPRPKLQALYEGFGFRWHSNRQVGSFEVARYEYPISTDVSPP